MEGIGAATAPGKAPPPPTRRAAWAATLRGLLAWAADAAVDCFLVALWLCNATNAAFIAARRVCGEDSRATAVAKQLFAVVLVALGLLVSFAAPLLLWRAGNGSRKAKALAELLIGRDGDAKRPAAQERRPEGTGACGRQDGLCPFTTHHILVFFTMVIVLGSMMQVLAPENESCEGRVGSMLTDIGSFHVSVIFCFVTFPYIVILLRASYSNVKRGTAGLL